MAVRARFRDVLMFAAGVVATGLLAAVLFWMPGLVAARSCPFEHLKPSLIDGGKWSEDGLKLRYKIPDCFINDEGYIVGSVDKVDSYHITITYRK